MGLGFLMILFLLGMACRRLRTEMPVTGNCSAAISAACHYSVSPMPSASLVLLKRGEVPLRYSGMYIGSSYGSGYGSNYGNVECRCAFSPEQVSAPTAGVMYVN